MNAPTPLDQLVRVRLVDDEIHATYHVDADETVLAGHYPGFPIFPGVCLLECVNRAVGAAAARQDAVATLTVVESCRFVAPVFPGDTVTVRARVEPVDGGWLCRATVNRGDERAVTVRLRYRLDPA